MRAVLKETRAPLSLYRLQLGPGVGFLRAAELVPYLQDLGVDAVYFSPYFKTAPGANAYAITDPAALNPDLGSVKDFDRLCARLRAAGMGHIADIVPNHMGIVGESNPYWSDVLEFGRRSRCAEFFDIDWAPVKPELKDKVLLPVLEDFYGRVLESGLIALRYADGRFHIAYRNLRFPASPRSWAMALGQGLKRGSRELPPADELELRRAVLRAARGDGEEAARRLAALERRSKPARKLLGACAAAYDGTKGDPSSFDRLDGFLELQHYRLAHWRVASDEINYRRFFNCNDLAAVRIEQPAVFEACHRLVFRLLEEGKVTGLRVDYPDGIYDPPAYFRRLQEGYLKRRLARAGAATAEIDAVLAEGEFKSSVPLFVVVEKILDRKETLPQDWRVHGTVGYDALNALNGIFVDSANEAAMDAAYENFIGRRRKFSSLIYQAKRQFLRTSMAGEIDVLGHRLDAISETSRHYRDFTRRSLTAAVREVVECFPVYRTYISPSSRTVSKRDERYIRIAISKARKTAPTISPGVFDFLRDVLLLKIEESIREDQRPLYRDFVMRFQQLTAPIMAKGLEDTAFYIDHRLVSLNEVGGDPGHFGFDAEEFHQQNRERARRWPRGVVVTSTHDTKRSEDVRLRINVLSEIPGEWKLEASRWAILNRAHKTLIERIPEPDPDIEYFLYQNLVGIWPDEEMSAAEHGALIERMREYARKSAREAKRRTDWNNPNEEYEAALDRFISAVLRRAPENEFLKSFIPFQKRVAKLGRLNSISSLALKLACPGAVDTYQGDELWNYRLVDPDNRRDVDFARRRGALESLQALLASGRPRAEVVDELLRRPEDGRIKMFVLREGLHQRKRSPELFIGGDYASLKAVGPRAEHIVAFIRRSRGSVLIAAAGRFFSRLLPLGERAWEATALSLPPDCGSLHLRDAYTGRRPRLKRKGGQSFIAAEELFSPLSAAMLVGGRD